MSSARDARSERIAVTMMDSQERVRFRQSVNRCAEGLYILIKAAMDQENLPVRRRHQRSLQDAHKGRDANSCCQKNERALMLLADIKEEFTARRCNF